MTFKITLRAARVNSGLTLKEVAEKTRKCVDTISKYESDATYVPHELMVMLLELYNVPYIHIFFGRESEFLGLNKNKVS